MTMELLLTLRVAYGALFSVVTATLACAEMGPCVQFSVYVKVPATVGERLVNPLPPANCVPDQPSFGEPPSAVQELARELQRSASPWPRRKSVLLGAKPTEGASTNTLVLPMIVGLPLPPDIRSVYVPRVVCVT